MGCCGQKRLQWRQETAASTSREKTYSNEGVPVENKTPILFEYVGRSSLTVKGAITGQSYYFKSSGSKVEVAPADAFAMMAENDLKRG